MVIWSGLGILVGLAGVVGLVLANLLTDLLTGDKTYYASHLWTKLGGAVAASLLSFIVVMLLERGSRGRIVIDKATGREMVIRRRDSLFFIPAEYLPYIILVIGIIAALTVDQ